MEEPNYPEEEIDLRGLIEVLWKRKWLILAIIILSVAVAGFLSFFILSPVYEAEVFVELRFPEQVEKQEAYRLQIEDPYFLSQIIEKLELNHQEYTPFSLQEALAVEMVKNTNFLKITVKDGDPERAAEIANTIASQFVDFAIRSTQEDVQKELLLLEEGMKEWQSKLTEVGERRRDFLTQSEITILERELATKEALWWNFERDLALLEVQGKELQATWEKTKEELAREPQYLKLQHALFSNLEKGNNMAGLVGGFFPLAIEVEEVNAVYNNLKVKMANLEAQLQGVEARKKTTSQAAEKMQVELKELESALLEKAAERDRLQREYDATLETYNSFIQEYEKTQVHSRSEEVNAGVRVVAPAIPPEAPVSPRKMLNLAIAAVLGIFVGIIAAFVTEYWQKTAPGPGK